MAVIVIDPGHGGAETNYDSQSNKGHGKDSADNEILEKNITWRLGLRLKKLLDPANHEVHLTRPAESCALPESDYGRRAPAARPG